MANISIVRCAQKFLPSGSFVKMAKVVRYDTPYTVYRKKVKKQKQKQKQKTTLPTIPRELNSGPDIRSAFR